MSSEADKLVEDIMAWSGRIRRQRFVDRVRDVATGVFLLVWSFVFALAFGSFLGLIFR
jgi:hypothetical protein